MRVEPIRAFTVICLVFAPTFAAAEMPRHDVEAHCTEIAGFGGEYSAMMYDGCFDMEQGAYDNLKARWDALPGSMRNHCNEIATFGGPGSYAMLEGCVQMEEQAVGTDNTFQY